MSTSALADALDAVAELGDQQLGRVLVDRLGQRDRHAHLEQRLDQVGAALGHAVGEFLDGDRLGDDDVADLLGRRAGLHVVALFLLAGAAERGERAGAAVVLVGQRAADGELAALAAIVAAAARARRLGAASARAHGRRDGGRVRSSSSSARRCGAAASGSGGSFGGAASLFLEPRRAASSAAASSALRFSSARRRSSSLAELCGLLLAAARFLERGQARFLGLAQQARLQLLAARRSRPAADGLRGCGAPEQRASAPAWALRRRARAWAPRAAALRPGGRGCGAS